MFQQTQPKDKMIHHDILVRPWDIVGAGLFTLNNKHYLCIVDYHSKFPIIKKAEDLSADSLILKCKVIFAEYGIPCKIISGSGGNFISDKFKTFCKSLNIEQALFIVLPPAEQWTGRCMYKIHKAHIKDML